MTGEGTVLGNQFFQILRPNKTPDYCYQDSSRFIISMHNYWLRWLGALNCRSGPVLRSEPWDLLKPQCFDKRPMFWLEMEDLQSRFISSHSTHPAKIAVLVQHKTQCQDLPSDRTSGFVGPTNVLQFASMRPFTAWPSLKFCQAFWRDCFVLLFLLLFSCSLFCCVFALLIQTVFLSAFCLLLLSTFSFQWFLDLGPKWRTSS